MPKATSARTRTRSKGKVGRPSLINDRQRVARLLEAVRGGNWLSTAAALAGIGVQTVTNWLSRGRDARALAEAGATVPAGERVYTAFADDFERAEAEAEMRVVANLMEQTRTSPQASLGFLKIRWPKRWREQPSQVEMSGPQGAPLPLSPVLAAMSDEELQAKARQLDAQLAEDQPE